jgi:predicted ATPase/DNA-binding NarL/FixJ family response regulator
MGIPRHIPLPVTPLLGRIQEMAQLEQLLPDPTIRLVTLVGPGGAGKTRLALEAGRTVCEQFADGALFVSLAHVYDVDLVLPTLAQAFNLSRLGNQSLLASVGAWLADQELLLILDNLEQVIDVAALLVQLLALAPKLTLLVTSREVLNVQGEYRLPVPPLSLPPSSQPMAIEQLSEFSATRLFIERAKAARPHIPLNANDAQSIATICQRLDGLPLAIELVAAYTKVFTPQELLTRFSYSLDVPVGGARDLPNRQQTLRQCIDWSYQRLTPEEQTVFCYLSVLVSSWTMAAVEQICAGQANVVATVLALVNKSLVVEQTTHDGQTRFTMLQTIAEFAREQAILREDFQTICQRHANYYLQMVAQAAPHLRDQQQAHWLRQLDAEQGNIYAALQWTLDHAVVESIELFPSINLWITYRRRHGDVWWIERMLEASSSIRSGARVETLSTAGWFILNQGLFAQAETIFEQALGLARDLQIPMSIGLALHGVGEIAYHRGDYAQAIRLYEESVQIFEQLDDHNELAWSLDHLGRACIQQGQWKRAALLFARAHQLFSRLGHLWGDAFALNHCGIVAAAQQDYDQAQHFIEASIAIAEQLHDPWHRAEGLHQLGLIALARQQHDQALTALYESFSLRRQHQLLPMIASSLEALARVAQAQHHWSWAVQLSSRADSLRLQSGEPMPATEQRIQQQVLDEAKKLLGEPQYHHDWEQGQQLELDMVTLRQPTPQTPTPLLTKREHELLTLIAQGKSNSEIALELVLSPFTVNNHLRAIYRKLGVSTRSAAAYIARERGLLESLEQRV